LSYVPTLPRLGRGIIALQPGRGKAMGQPSSRDAFSADECQAQE